MCRWTGLHFHDWIDYKGVAFSTVRSPSNLMGSCNSIESLVWGRTFSDFWSKTVLHIYG